ncbi:oxidoreductase [Staphylococcus pragensis]|nr:SDR family oxidoreductase [Staphylococcus pragensis]GGG95548.1 oxidoreductase [Staphylococcus pragensis]
MRLENKVALITGSGGGMGYETAKHFVEEGAIVIVPDLKEDVVNEAVQSLSKSTNNNVYGYVLDVSKETSVEETFNHIKQDIGKLDILINCAGITGADKTTDQLTEEEWDQVFAVDVKGVFFCTKHAVPLLRDNGGGSIVNFSSILGLVGTDELTPYAAAKGAVTNMTRQDAISFGKDHIRVNSVHPGTILTPLVKKLGEETEGGLEAYTAKMSERHPIGYLGEPVDVANAVLFLASDEARFITGAALTVDGGYTAR